MEKLNLLRRLSEKVQFTSSPSQFLLFSSPLMLAVIGVLIFAFQINQQLYEQQQAIVGRLAHAAVRHTAQLQREHLRLYAIIEGTRDTVIESGFQAQQDLVESRIRVMESTVLASDPPAQVYALYDDYVAGWLALQPLLNTWRVDPQNELAKEELTEAMREVERSANGILILVQASFEDHMAAWAKKSQFLNQLLILGSVSFAIIILIVSYTAFLFIRSQAMSERVLRESEQRLRSILEAVPDAVYRVSRSGFYTDYKPAINDPYSLAKGEVVGKSIQDMFLGDAGNLVEEGIATVLQSGEQLIVDLPLFNEQTAEIHHYEARLLPSGTDEVQIVSRDVTRAKQQEEATLQAQKLESLGVLAGGIAHDFNNLLTGMLGQASLAIAKMDRGLPAMDNIKKLVLTAERASDLTRQMLAYTGKGKFQVGSLDINEVIRDTTGLLSTSLPTYATLDLHLFANLPQVLADRSQIQQVVMNLFINAIEALPDGKGKIEITTNIQHVNEEWVDSILAESNATSDTLQTGQYVVIRVVDTGCGMDQATLRRIFDPFFTTKSKGHGLGLSATSGIMRTHEGLLQAQSQIGVGTTFTVLLPAIVKELPCTVEAISAPTPECVSGTILIIDDEKTVRDTVSETLELAKYNVKTAESGKKGVEVYCADKNDIDVVLLDLKMPGMNGRETHQRLRQIRTNIKIIFMSGYSEDEVSSLINKSEYTTFLPKPFSAELLLREVNHMLLL